MIRKPQVKQYNSIDEIDEAIRQLKENKRSLIAQDKKTDKEYASKVEAYLGKKLYDLLPDWKELDWDLLESFLLNSQDSFSSMTVTKRSVSEAVEVFDSISSKPKKVRGQKQKAAKDTSQAPQVDVLKTETAVESPEGPAVPNVEDLKRDVGGAAQEPSVP